LDPAVSVDEPSFGIHHESPPSTGSGIGSSF